MPFQWADLLAGDIVSLSDQRRSQPGAAVRPIFSPFNLKGQCRRVVLYAKCGAVPTGAADDMYPVRNIPFVRAPRRFQEDETFSHHHHIAYR